MKKSLRNLLIFLGIAVVLFALYFIFFQKGQTPAPQSTSGLSSTARNSAATPLAASGRTTTAGTQLLALLGRVSSLTLNDDILANPSFDMLQDISITLPAVDAKGRRNPFAPIGTANSSTTTTPATTATGSSSVTPNQ